MSLRAWVIGSAAVVALGVVGNAAVSRGPDEAVVDRFVSEARAATRHYANRQAAIDDGFTRIGVEFPAMGEHWVSFARVLEDSFDVARPTVLIYANTDSGPRLAGVAYTRLLTHEEKAPSFPTDHAWHEHNGAVDEESLPLRHGAHLAPSHADGPRLAILHAWIWSKNPAGVFETDNWSLPLDRWGVAAELKVERRAVQALSLAQDRDEYLRLMLRTSLDLTPAEDSIAGAVIRARTSSIARLAEPVRRARTLSRARSDSLRVEWDSLWAELGAALPDHRPAIVSLHGRM